ncbi:MAG TPA: MarR family transcriptional regulator [Candidatus Limnocylindria bacterium]|nr:MarR family transcriptional regulator [Candidatus Limnocylindria bacterium]
MTLRDAAAPVGAPAPEVETSEAERIRREFARAWGEIGAAWGVAPSTAAVQGYFLAHGGPLTEPEIRRALGMSHRAASAALAQCEEWGLIERAPDARRSGQRGPAAAAYRAVGDHWTWFRHVTRARKERETDPVLPVLDRCVSAASAAAQAGDAGAEVAELASRLGALREFVRLFDHGVDAFITARPQATASLFAVVGRLDEGTLNRLFALLDRVPPDDAAEALRTLSRLSPDAAQRLVRLAGQPMLARLLGGTGG